MDQSNSAKQRLAALPCVRPQGGEASGRGESGRERKRGFLLPKDFIVVTISVCKWLRIFLGQKQESFWSSEGIQSLGHLSQGSPGGGVRAYGCRMWDSPVPQVRSPCGGIISRCMKFCQCFHIKPIFSSVFIYGGSLHIRSCPRIPFSFLLKFYKPVTWLGFLLLCESKIKGGPQWGSRERGVLFLDAPLKNKKEKSDYTFRYK